MLVRYWQPFREVESLRRQFDRMFDDLMQTDTDAQTTWAPTIELSDEGDSLMLKAQIPGVDAKDLDVQVSRNAVSISGEHRTEERKEQKGYFHSEFRYGKFQRVVSLPVAIENTEITADYKDGVLMLTLPKAAEARNKVVKVSLGGTTDAPALDSTDAAAQASAN
jgi:HSP20 family protein